MSLTALRQQLADLLAPPPVEGEGLRTGVGALDEAIAGSGLPRGRLTEIVGVRGSGKTTFVRCLVEATVSAGHLVAYVDAARTLAPRDWAHLGEREGVWMIRPRDPGRGAWCADVLLRSGAFALVVIDGAPPLSRQVAVRLTRLARDGRAAFVVVGESSERGGTATLGSAVRLRLTGRHCTRGRRWPGPGEQGLERRFGIVVEKGGTYRTVEVSCAIGVARRLCTHSEVPDRRGVARDVPRVVTGRGAVTGAAAAPTPVHATATVNRGRRCAEPSYGRESRALRTAVARVRAMG